MLPEISLGPLTLYTFGIMSVLGCILGGAIGARRFRELDYPGEWAWDLTIILMLAGVFGGTLLYTIENGRSIEDVPSLILSGQGMTWYGSIGLGAILAILWSRFHRMPFWDMFSGVIFGFVATQMLGRIGCQLSGDGDYGIPWDGPWAMGYPNGTVPTPPGVEVHPTPVYEALGMFFLLWFLWHFRWRFSPQVLCGSWMIGASLIRFPVEFIRTNPEIFLSLTLAQWISLALFVAGVVVIIVYRNKPGAIPLHDRKVVPDLRFFPWEDKEKRVVAENLQKKAATQQDAYNI